MMPQRIGDQIKNIEFKYDIGIGVALGVLGNGLFFLLKEYSLTEIPNAIILDSKLLVAFLYPIVALGLLIYFRKSATKEKNYEKIPTNDIAIEGEDRKNLIFDLKKHLNPFLESETNLTVDGNNIYIKKNDENLVKLVFDSYIMEFQWYENSDYVIKKAIEFLKTCGKGRKKYFKEDKLKKLLEPQVALGKIK